MNTLQDALQEALESKKNDYSAFVWKGEKRKEGTKFVQDSERLIDMSPERLRECYKHCNTMLYNDDPKNLGRYNVLDEITSQITKCNTELFLRYLENSYLRREGYAPMPRFRMMINTRTFIKNSEEEAEQKGIKLNWRNISITHLVGEIPAEFQDLSISNLLEGCIDNLGAFNKQHLTLTFITNMGLWFTKAEENEFKGASNSEKLKMAKERLHLPDKFALRFNERGLSYHEMRAMLVLPKKQKYSDMTTEQLLTLRNKVLFRFQKQVDGHIFSWKRLQRQIELVAKSKGINLKDNVE